MSSSEKLKFVLPAIWAGFIILNSFSQPKVKLHYGSDKVAHIVLYLPMGLTISNLLLPKYLGIKNLFLSVLVGGLFLGSIDEFIQSYVPQRESSLWDTLTDVTGTLLGAVIRLRLLKRNKIIK